MNMEKFLFYLPGDLLTEAQAIAKENGLCTSAFIRQSIIQNIHTYKASMKAIYDNVQTKE